jgi:hypothetical protein
MNEVDDWFATKKPPAESVLQRVRQVILGAHPRMTEYVKYDTVQFAFGGDMANFVQTNKKTVSLMFHRGGRIEGTFPHMEEPVDRSASCASPTWRRSTRERRSWRLPSGPVPRSRSVADRSGAAGSLD